MAATASGVLSHWPTEQRTTSGPGQLTPTERRLCGFRAAVTPAGEANNDHPDEETARARCCVPEAAPPHLELRGLPSGGSLPHGGTARPRLAGSPRSNARDTPVICADCDRAITREYIVASYGDSMPGVGPMLTRTRRAPRSAGREIGRGLRSGVNSMRRNPVRSGAPDLPRTRRHHHRDLRTHLRAQ